MCVRGGWGVKMSLLAKRLHIKSEYDCVTFGVGELLSQPLLLAGLNCCCRGFHAGGCVIVLHRSTQVKDCSVTHSRPIKGSHIEMRRVLFGGAWPATISLLSPVGAPSPCQLGPRSSTLVPTVIVKVTHSDANQTRRSDHVPRCHQPFSCVGKEAARRL